MMRDAEDAALDRTPSGGAAAVMQSAAARNQRLGVMGETENLEAAHDADERSMAISEARVPGGRVVTEFVADQPVKQYFEADEEATHDAGSGVLDGTKITIGEALEATTFSTGDQAVEPSDAEAIAAAEARAAGTDEAPPDKIAARARATVEANACAEQEEDKTTIRDVLADATSRLGTDKDVDREDAVVWVVAAEMRAEPDAAARPGGVAASVAAAARLNCGQH
ncbi:hypothetical protein QOZ80_2BG0180980 [Eleusine coracana subsp. coracana]|nr:hypothetical protein QOZ80_2BG0180980 [Eleusine coracana subsp. coracana]